MHSLVLTILFLLTTPLALSHYIPPPVQSSPCYRLPIVQATYIYFTSPSDPDFTFFIATPWKTAYKNTLRNSITQHGFKLTAEPFLSLRPTVGSVEMCGWVVAERVIVRGVHHGDGGYKFSPPPFHHEVPGTLDNSSAVLAPRQGPPPFDSSITMDVQPHPGLIPDPLPPHSSSVPAPHNTTIATIRNILISHSPTRDFAVFIVQIMLPMIFVALIILVVEWHLNRRAVKQAAAAAEEEEAVAVYNLDQEAVERPASVSTTSTKQREYCVGFPLLSDRWSKRIVDIKEECKVNRDSRVLSDPVGETYEISSRTRL